VLLFNLFGDPLLRLPRPGKIRLETAKTATAGRRLRITGKVPIGGALTLEIACRRDRTIVPPPRRARSPITDWEMVAYDTVYAHANDRRWTAASGTCVAGEFVAELDIPFEASGPAHVRAFLDGPQGHALGDCEIVIEQAREPRRVASRRITDERSE
jgi:hypothetical protein